VVEAWIWTVWLELTVGAMIVVWLDTVGAM